MRRSFRGKGSNTVDLSKELRVNEKILAKELMVIDEAGLPLGLLETSKALEEATTRGFDLVEVSPKAVPPIAKFMDFGSYKYQKEKQERKSKSKNKTATLKTIKISTRIGQHDLDMRSNQAVKFLNDGDKVKIELMLRGREHQHVDLAHESIKKMVSDITLQITDKQLKTEQAISRLGSKLSTIISL
ncbi:MAG: translation initiation factor IF-3 [Patescibacteria group bacterium]|jgi:translation initiation factor IF-3